MVERCQGFDNLPCPLDATVRTEDTGARYCGLHAYLAAISGELTYPIDSTPAEREFFRRQVHGVADEIARHLKCTDCPHVAHPGEPCDEVRATKPWEIDRGEPCPCPRSRRG